MVNYPVLVLLPIFRTFGKDVVVSQKVVAFHLGSADEDPLLWRVAATLGACPIMGCSFAFWLFFVGL